MAGGEIESSSEKQKDKTGSQKMVTHGQQRQ